MAINEQGFLQEIILWFHLDVTGIIRNKYCYRIEDLQFDRPNRNCPCIPIGLQSS